MRPMTLPPNTTQRPPASISVIVPSHNGGKHLAEALDSILAQTLPVKQILIVDDGSTDDTADIVGRYQDRRIQFIRQARAGIVTACNVGLDAARGEFVTFLHPHDRWSGEFVERMYDYLVAAPAIVCAFSNFAHLDEATGKLLGDQFRFYPEIKRPVLLKDAPHAHGRIPQEKAFGALVSCSDLPVYLQVTMFRRSVIEGLRFDPALEQGANTSFVLQAFMRGMVVFTDEVLAIVRPRGDVAVQQLDALKALASKVTRERDQRPYQDRLVKAYIDAALTLTKSGRVRAGVAAYRESFKFPGLGLSKFQGSLRLLAALPQGLTK